MVTRYKVQGSKSEPLISCLMPTMPGRESMAKLAVMDFQSQTWPNKELIVASSGDPAAIQPFYNWVNSLGDKRIHTHFNHTEDNQKATLGEMRNFTNDKASGDWCCTWDDDDRNSLDRLQLHMTTADREQADITYLNQQLHCFPDVKKLYWVDWNNHRSPGYVCYRKTALRYQAHLSVEEDKYFLRELDAAGYKFAKVETEIPVYVRYFHGNNAWNRRHHEVLVSGHTAALHRIASKRQQITQFLKTMGICGPLDVMFRNTLVFQYR